MLTAYVLFYNTSSVKGRHLFAVINFMENHNRDSKWPVIRHFGYIPHFDKNGVADIDISEQWVTVLCG